MKSSNNVGDRSDPFFVSVEFDYSVWLNEPRSVKERREKFLQRMGFAEFAGSSWPERERLCETGGAVSSSLGMDSGSVEESLVSSSRESGNDADELIDESDGDQENEPPSSSESKQIEKQEGNSASKRRYNRWGSFLAKRRRSDLVADSFSAQFDCKERAQSPVLNKSKVWHHQKWLKEFTGLYTVQEIRAHVGAILTMKFSTDGLFLASGGSDGIVRVWGVNPAGCHFSDFSDSRGAKLTRDKFGSGRKCSSNSLDLIPNKVFWIDESPVHEFDGHAGDILDLAWSKSNLLLSSSTDKTVRLWKLGSDACLDIFQHINYVTCIQFNPVQENYFVSGSIDGKVRVWGVSERRVVDWADVRDVITAACYQPNGKGIVVGSVAGTCHFFDASGAHLHLDRAIGIQGRKKTLNRITSIQFSPDNSGRVMIASEDGKIRVLEGSDIIQKYRGLPKSGSQLSASFTSSGKHMVSVGDDSRVYLWNYGSSSVHPSNGKTAKSVRSCENFFSEAVSAALPWSSTGTDRSLLGIKSSKNLQYSCRRLEYPSDAKGGSDRFSVGNWLSIEGPCLGITATWPTEKLLPPWDLSEDEEYESRLDSKRDSAGEETFSDLVRVSETWGLVIVTASFDGKIRAFHNYGLPVRL